MLQKRHSRKFPSPNWNNTAARYAGFRRFPTPSPSAHPTSSERNAVAFFPQTSASSTAPASSRSATPRPSARRPPEPTPPASPRDSARHRHPVNSLWPDELPKLPPSRPPRRSPYAYRSPSCRSETAHRQSPPPHLPAPDLRPGDPSPHRAASSPNDPAQSALSTALRPHIRLLGSSQLDPCQFGLNTPSRFDGCRKSRLQVESPSAFSWLAAEPWSGLESAALDKPQFPREPSRCLLAVRPPCDADPHAPSP